MHTTQPDEVNAYTATANMDRDALYAYHLHRVVNKFKTVISADNVELLARLLDEEGA